MENGFCFSSTCKIVGIKTDHNWLIFLEIFFEGQYKIKTKNSPILFHVGNLWGTEIELNNKYGFFSIALKNHTVSKQYFSLDGITIQNKRENDKKFTS